MAEGTKKVGGGTGGGTRFNNGDAASPSSSGSPQNREGVGFHKNVVADDNHYNSDTDTDTDTDSESSNVIQPPEDANKYTVYDESTKKKHIEKRKVLHRARDLGIDIPPPDKRSLSGNPRYSSGLIDKIKKSIEDTLKAKKEAKDARDSLLKQSDGDGNIKFITNPSRQEEAADKKLEENQKRIADEIESLLNHIDEGDDVKLKSELVKILVSEGYTKEQLTVTEGENQTDKCLSLVKGILPKDDGNKSLFNRLSAELHKLDGYNPSTTVNPQEKRVENMPIDDEKGDEKDDGAVSEGKEKGTPGEPRKEEGKEATPTGGDKGDSAPVRIGSAASGDKYLAVEEAHKKAEEDLREAFANLKEATVKSININMAILSENHEKEMDKLRANNDKELDKRDATIKELTKNAATTNGFMIKAIESSGKKFVIANAPESGNGGEVPAGDKAVLNAQENQMVSHSLAKVGKFVVIPLGVIALAAGTVVNIAESIFQADSITSFKANYGNYGNFGNIEWLWNRLSIREYFKNSGSTNPTIDSLVVEPKLDLGALIDAEIASAQELAKSDIQAALAVDPRKGNLTQAELGGLLTSKLHNSTQAAFLRSISDMETQNVVPQNAANLTREELVTAIKNLDEQTAKKSDRLNKVIKGHEQGDVAVISKRIIEHQENKEKHLEILKAKVYVEAFSNDPAAKGLLEAHSIAAEKIDELPESKEQTLKAKATDSSGVDVQDEPEVEEAPVKAEVEEETPFKPEVEYEAPYSDAGTGTGTDDTSSRGQSAALNAAVAAFLFGSAGCAFLYDQKRRDAIYATPKAAMEGDGTQAPESIVEEKADPTGLEPLVESKNNTMNI